FRGIDNYSFASPQPWSSPCPICNGKHGNYGLHGEWYRENGNQLPYDPELAKLYSKDKLEYCLTCNTSSNKLKFIIMASELEVLKQRITELEAENAELRKENTEIPDLRRKLVEIPDLRRKISVFDAERAELMRIIAETLKMTKEERMRRAVNFT
ncbi:6017_t:CDS:2, partial [Gigaspora rosea]